MSVRARVLAHDDDELEALLYGLARQCAVQLARGGIPPLYQSGVVYKREPLGRENWQSARESLHIGEADCEDLSAWRCGELMLQGIDARPRVLRINDQLRHVVVGLPDGTTEDPSKRLGM